jgi:hypothetical protein
VSIIKCPSNCECDYSFQHSIVTTVTNGIKDGIRISVRRTFIVCRVCGHWIGSDVPCNCKYACHEQPGAMDVVYIDLGTVNCS